MIENFSFEALAHYTRGLATMFFIMCALMTYRRRHRNRMTFLLFIVICYITISYLKDLIFIFSFFNQSIFIEDLNSIFDISCTPFVCAFFLETTCPGMFNKWRILLAYCLFAIFLPLYCVFPSEGVVLCVYILAALVGLITLALIPFYVVRYNQYLAENLSYTKNINVNWVGACAFIYFLWLSIYAFCFWDSTWLGEVMFCTFSITVWSIIWLFSSKHKVVMGMFKHDEEIVKENAEEIVESELDKTKEYAKEQLVEENKRKKRDFIAKALLRCMEVDKLYLNPVLSLEDLAKAVGSNKTYISSYINSQGKTFYDYVNEYRISEACRMMDTSEDHLSMTEVSMRSGFNSISSFNRYFLKIKGVTPTNYYRYRL